MPRPAKWDLKSPGSLKKKGAHVTVVCGPINKKPPKSLRVMPVVSAMDMYRTVQSKFSKADVFIATAAVSDYRFNKISQHKLKKSKPVLSTKLVKNPDILKEMGKKKKDHILIGFALETGNIQKEAKKKLVAKKLDLIIGNTPRSFGNKKIHATWMESSGLVWKKDMTKKELAKNMARWLEKKFK